MGGKAWGLLLRRLPCPQRCQRRLYKRCALGFGAALAALQGQFIGGQGVGSCGVQRGAGQNADARLLHLEMNGPAVSSGMGTCGLVGQIGVYTGWVESGKVITAFDWAGMVLVCFILPSVLSVIFCEVLRKKGWIKEGDLKL